MRCVRVHAHVALYVAAMRPLHCIVLDLCEFSAGCASSPRMPVARCQLIFLWRTVSVLLCSGIAGAVGTLLVLEQLSLLISRRDENGKLIAGPSFVLPFVGGLVAVIRDPVGFWEQQRLYAPKGLSANYILGKFMIFSTNNDVNRAVLSNNGPEGFDMALHPNAEWILGMFA